MRPDGLGDPRLTGYPADDPPGSAPASPATVC